MKSSREIAEKIKWLLERWPHGDHFCVAESKGGWSLNGDSLLKMINGYEEALEHSALREQVLVDALKKCSHGHFNAYDENGVICGACMMCDTGFSGRQQDEKGHDVECIISISATALAKYNKMREGM